MDRKSNFNNKSKGESVVITETPFDKRHCCWFCGEPSHVDFIFPPLTSFSAYNEDKYLLLNCPHPTLSVPCCGECQKLSMKAEVENIWSVNRFVKKQLLKRYRKDLAIGVNWTQEELANSEFETGNFSGFARSAWFMYEVAKSRVSYPGWPLVVSGIELQDQNFEGEKGDEINLSFQFDGVIYPSIKDALEHYANVFKLEPHYLLAVLQKVSRQGRPKGSFDYTNVSDKSFSKAIRFCRLLVGATPDERKLAFAELAS